MEVSDGINVGTEESFENKQTHVLFSVVMMTESTHVKRYDGRATLDDLS